MADSQPPSDLRSNYLDEAARLLLVTGPSTSAYLGAQNNELAALPLTRQVGTQTTSRCISCGTLQVPCWTTSKSLRTKATLRKTGVDVVPSKSCHDTVQKKRKTIMTTCLICNNIGSTAVVSNVRANSRLPQLSSTTSTTSPHANVQPQKSSMQLSGAKMTSKQRARDRKDRLGLQSLLQRPPRSTTGPGLDFMDLMRG